MKFAGFIPVALLLATIYAISAGATTEATQTEDSKLLPSDGAMLDEFGHGVSISGNTAVVGAPKDDDNGNASGSAYVFVRNGETWIEKVKLQPSDAGVNDGFGSAVSIFGDTAIVGAPFDDTHIGSAYVFVRSGDLWTEQDKLLASDGLEADGFGWAVSLSENTAVISGPGHAMAANEHMGSAYAFVRSGDAWTEQDKLLPGDVEAGDAYGVSVSVDGNTAIIGSSWDDDNGADSGSAYVFVRTGDVWAEQDKLVPGDGAADDYFGWTVAVFDDVAIIGAPHDDDNGASSGAAYVFVRSNDSWTEEQKLVPSDARTGQWFGRSVSMIGNTVIIGANGDDNNGAMSGAAYVFARTGGTWTEQVKLLPSDGVAVDHFGRAVSITTGAALTGAHMDDDNGMDSGSAYVFSVGMIFADGFESGDCSNWSEEVPEP